MPLAIAAPILQPMAFFLTQWYESESNLRAIEGESPHRADEAKTTIYIRGSQGMTGLGSCSPPCLNQKCEGCFLSQTSYSAPECVHIIIGMG